MSQELTAGLRHCRHCIGRVSADAKACPRCGVPDPALQDSSAPRGRLSPTGSRPLEAELSAEDRKYAAEYRQHAELHERLEVSLEDYIRTRRIDDGLDQTEYNWEAFRPPRREKLNADVHQPLNGIPPMEVNPLASNLGDDDPLSALVDDVIAKHLEQKLQSQPSPGWPHDHMREKQERLEREGVQPPTVIVQRIVIREQQPQQ